jgi:lipoprotein-releasing system ATP-binding protein
MSEAALRLVAISRRFRQGEAWLEVLRGVDLELAPGAVVALMGPSGSGKSTLLQIAGLLEHPDGGEVHIGGRACGRLSDGERTRIRRETLGFVYQFHHLLPEFTALENVMLPHMLAGQSKAVARERARHLLAVLGLDQRETHRPARLSGGEQQRVAIARAMANRPALLLADEPTGNLDEMNGENALGHLRDFADRGGAVVLATHDHRAMSLSDRTFVLEKGVIHNENTRN